MEQTSIDVYNEIVKDGLVNRVQQQVLGVLAKATAPLTSCEIRNALGFEQNDCISPRLGELVRIGCVAKGERRKCGITERVKNTYRFTGEKPTEAPSRLVKCPHCCGTGKVLKEVQLNLGGIA